MAINPNLPVGAKLPTEDEIEYYYDSHPTREDLMPTSLPHNDLILYLVGLLRWYYNREQWLVTGDFAIYHTFDLKEYPLAPDVALFKETVVSEADKGRLRSWKMVTGRPAPTVTFEFASKDTWREDLNDKPAQYGAIGAKEYYAYDPNTPTYWPRPNTRLCGWWYDENGTPIEQTPDNKGRIWSAELDSWLVPDKAYLRLYDRDGNQRLTEAEEFNRRSLAAQAERDREEAARLEAETAQKQAQAARQEAETAKEAAERQLRELMDKLREKGIDPDAL